jgi:hypothetical protein
MRFLRIPFLLFCAALAVVVFLAGCKAQAAPKTVLLCGFENTPNPEANSLDPLSHFQHPINQANDYLWDTSNYVVLEPFNKLASQGKYCAKSRFTIPGDLRVITPDKKPKSWEAGMTLSTESGTKLSATDWSPYRSVSLDIYNPEDKEYQAYLRIGDVHSKITVTAALVKPKGRTVVAIAVTRLAEAWLDATDIKFLTLFLDTADLGVDPVLYIDNVKLQ